MNRTTPEAGQIPRDTSVATAESPFQRPVTFGRRSLLAGLLGLGVGAYLDSSPLTSWTAYAVKPKAGNGVARTPPGPYAVTATSELSDDVFATSDVLIGPDDEIVPFYNPFSKGVEALVVSGGTLSHLHRDPLQATGWAYAGFDLQQTLNSVTAVALATDTSGTGRVYALLQGTPGRNNPGGSPYWLTWLDDSTSWDSGFLLLTNEQQFPPNLGPIKGGISAEGIAYFYGTSVSGNVTSLVGWVTTGNDTQPLAELTLLTLPPTTTVQDCMVLYDTSETDTVGYAAVLTGDGMLNVHPQSGETFRSTPDEDAGTVGPGVTALLWAWTSFDQTKQQPGVAFQGTVQGFGSGTMFIDEDGNFEPLSDTTGVGANTVTVWRQAGLYTVNLLDPEGTLTSFQESSSGAWADMVPLTTGAPGSPQPGLVSVFGVPADPTRSTLFAVGADETLSVLTLDDTGWTQTQVRQDAATAVSLTCYRLTISLVDSNGSPIRYGQAQLSSDRLVGLWQDVGSTILVPGTPVTMTSDLSGQIILSVPAEELDTAVLTVQALDGSGQLSGSALSVAGDYDVRNFFGGAAPLNDLGVLDASTFTDGGSGKGLLPGLHPADASDLVTHLNQSIAAGVGGPPPSGAVRAYRLERHGKRLTLSTSHDAKAYGSAAVGASLDHLFHTIGHSLRHALAKVVSTTIRWADDLKQWVVDLATDVTDLATYAINSMRDAFHIIGGWLSTLGADITAAVSWLKREVMHFLSAVGKNATTLETVIGQGPDQLISIVNTIEKQVDQWFAGQEDTVTGWISELESAVEDATFGSSQPLGAPPSDTGSSTAMNNLSSNMGWIGKVVNDSPGMWLYHKLMQYLPSDPGPDMSGDFDQVLQDLATAWDDDAVPLADNVVHLVYQSFQGITSHDQMSQAKVSTLFGTLNQIAHDALQLCDKIADTVLDFTKAVLKVLESYLSYQWPLDGPFPILRLVLDQLGFDPTISLNRLVSLAVAFPLTLVRTLTGRDPVFTTGGAEATASADSGDSFCYLAAAVSQFIWTVADIGGDAQLTVPEGEEARPQQSGIIDYFDILCPLLQTLVLLPGRDGNLIWNGLPMDTNLPGLVGPAIFTSIITPVFKIVDKAVPAPAAPTTNPNVIPYYKDAPAEPDVLSQYFGPIVSSLGAAANGVLGGMYSYKNSDDKTDAVLSTVFGNASNLVSPFTTAWLNAGTDDVPLLVKVLLDLAAGLGAGIEYAKNV